jgi:hypothetical protein
LGSLATSAGASPGISKNELHAFYPDYIPANNSTVMLDSSQTVEEEWSDKPVPVGLVANFGRGWATFDAPVGEGQSFYGC